MIVSRAEIGERSNNYIVYIKLVNCYKYQNIEVNISM